MISDNAVERLWTCSSLLSQHTKIHILSCGLTISAVISALITAVMGQLDGMWLAVVLMVMACGVVETIVAVRIGFDAALLQRLSRQKTFAENDLEALDQALIAMGLIPEGKKGRSLDARLQGCVALLKKQVLWTSVQLFGIVAAAAWAVIAS